MIANLTDYALTSSNVIKFNYVFGVTFVASSQLTFKVTDYITDALRAVYNYKQSTSKIVAVEIKISNLVTEYTSASTMNAPIILTITHNASNFTRLGSGWYNMIGPLERGSTVGTTITSRITNPVSALFYVVNYGNYTTSNFVLNCSNVTTGSVISSSDYVTFNLEISEFVLQN